jgi:predicted protein tyrosine phosphatase
VRCGVGTVEQALVVSRVVLLVEASRKTEVRKLHVTAFVDKNVVWLDIAVDY